MVIWVLVAAAAWAGTIWLTVAIVGGRIRAAARPTGEGALPRKLVADDESADVGEFIRYPTDHMFAVVNEASAAGEAFAALQAVGIEDDDLSTFTGNAGAIRIDASGTHHGIFARLLRVAQAMSMDGDQSQRYEDEARKGHTVIAVHSADPVVRQRALQILKSHGGHYINYYARLHSENLEP